MPPSLRRANLSCVGFTPFAVRNVEDGETVHQACLLVSGQCHMFSGASEHDYVSAVRIDSIGETSGPQHWPVMTGTWKALVMLSPGANHIEFELHHAGGVSGHHKLTVNYLPLLQLPPLHLAIMVAKDSPLLIDCPPSKAGAISSAHSSLDAAVAKLRTTAYMWQAFTAEDMRAKGLGRRSFRLDEEWSLNTTTQNAFRHTAPAYAKNGTVPRVHLVRTEKTVAELLNPMYAQQSSCASKPDQLHKIFEDALKAYGGLFTSSSRPVVAGLILDSAFCIESDLIRGHAAMGCHRADGISLGMFGSHLTYAWPRYLEEIAASLDDTADPGDTVGNNKGTCNTHWQACSVGQGAFLHEVGHAFGADHATSGIMGEGWSNHWPCAFIGPTDKDHRAKWDLQSALRFKLMPHFKLPSDESVTPNFATASLDLQLVFDADTEGISIVCAAGLASVEIQNGENVKRTELMDWKRPCTEFSIEDIRRDHDQSKSLSITALAMNGKDLSEKDVWRFLRDKPFVRVPGSDMMLRKQSVKSDCLNEEPAHHNRSFHSWAMLLSEKGADGQLHRATSIDLRVGCTMDGAVVYYEDGHHANCGPAGDHGFGGHASQRHDLSPTAEIVKVELRTVPGNGWGSLEGIRMTLDDGTKWGELHDFDSTDYHEPRGSTVTLVPASGQKIVGFFGQSDTGYGFTYEFGILTAPIGRDLPAAAFEMRELRNDANDVNDSREDAEGGEMEVDGETAECDSDADSEDYDNLSEHTLA